MNEVTTSARRLVDELTTTAPPAQRNREVVAAQARAPDTKRFGN